MHLLLKQKRTRRKIKLQSKQQQQNTNEGKRKRIRRIVSGGWEVLSPNESQYVAVGVCYVCLFVLYIIRIYREIYMYTTYLFRDFSKKLLLSP